MPSLKRSGFAIALIAAFGALALSARSPASAVTFLSPSSLRPLRLPTTEERVGRRSLPLEMLEQSGESASTGRNDAEGERMVRDRELYQELRSMPNRSSMQSQMMRNLELTNRYPPSNQTFFSRTHDPIARRHLPDRRSETSADGKHVLTVWASANQVDLGSKVSVFAVLTEVDPRTHSTSPSRGELALTLRRDGEKKETALPLERQGDGRYVATIDSAAFAGQHLSEGFYRVTAKGPQQLTSSTSFGLREPYGRLTGAYRDRLEAGSLLVEAEFEAFEAARYYAVATLYTDDDIPIGTAEAALELAPGTHWIGLRFFGRLVRDAGRSGPYRLAHISVEKRGLPMSTGVKAAPDFLTHAYPWSQLSNEPYNDLESELQED